MCFYHKLYERSAFDLKKTIEDACESYKIKIGKAELVKMTSEDPEEWIKQITLHFTKPFNLVLILLDDYFKYKNMYDPIKAHSLETKGYPTQILLTSCLNNNRRKLSIVSNILLQVNTKLGGVSYKIDFSSEIKNKNLMIVGVDSSKMKNDCLSVAMCATLDNNFTKYTNKKIIIESKKTGLHFPLSSFIYEAILEYFKFNKKLPSGIIIYRQGVSIEQKQQLTSEVKEIQNMLNGNETNFNVLKNNAIPFYYILVNKKSSLKLFEIEKTSKFSNVNYCNPDCGLLVYDGLINSSLFEFYIQPQKVVSGCASPSHFHVAYGNLNQEEYAHLIPKLTYDLCFLYSNWRGTVRVPAPLKYAEKLSKVLPKLHNNVKNSLYYV